MGRKTLLAGALVAALAGLTACGTAVASGGQPAGQATSGRPAASASSTPQAAADTSRLPAGIGAVRITLVPGMNDKSKPPGPVTVTSQAKVGQLVALVNGLSASPSGTYNCPMDDGRGVSLMFFSAADGKELGTAFAAGNGCGGVTLTVGTKKSALGWGSGPAEKALAIAGIHWSTQGPA